MLHYFVTGWREKGKYYFLMGILQLYFFQQWAALLKFTETGAVHPNGFLLVVFNRRKTLSTLNPLLCLWVPVCNKPSTNGITVDKKMIEKLAQDDVLKQT